MTQEPSKRSETSSWQLKELFQGEQWFRLERLLSRVRYNALLRLAQRLEPNETARWRGFIEAVDYILTGSLEHDSADLMGVPKDQPLEPVEDYMAREPEEDSDA
jgi:hypothetical protein